MFSIDVTFDSISADDSEALSCTSAVPHRGAAEPLLHTVYANLCHRRERRIGKFSQSSEGDLRSLVDAIEMWLGNNVVLFALAEVTAGQKFPIARELHERDLSNSLVLMCNRDTGKSEGFFFSVSFVISDGYSSFFCAPPIAIRGFFADENELVAAIRETLGEMSDSFSSWSLKSIDIDRSGDVSISRYIHNRSRQIAMCLYAPRGVLCCEARGGKDVWGSVTGFSHMGSFQTLLIRCLQSGKHFIPGSIFNLCLL